MTAGGSMCTNRLEVDRSCFWSPAAAATLFLSWSAIFSRAAERTATNATLSTVDSVLRNLHSERRQVRFAVHSVIRQSTSIVETQTVGFRLTIRATSLNDRYRSKNELSSRVVAEWLNGDDWPVSRRKAAVSICLMRRKLYRGPSIGCRWNWTPRYDTGRVSARSVKHSETIVTLVRRFRLWHNQDVEHILPSSCVEPTANWSRLHRDRMSCKHSSAWLAAPLTGQFRSPHTR